MEIRESRRLAEALTGAPAGRHGSVAALVGVARTVSASPAPVDVDPEFQHALRQRLVAMATIHGVGPQKATGRPVGVRAPGRRRVAVVAAAAAVAGVAAGGVNFAAGNTVPGDALYGAKRGREAAQLALAPSDTTRAQLHAQFAAARLREARSVAGDPAKLKVALVALTAELKAAMRSAGAAATDRRDTGPLDIIDNVIDGQRAQLRALLAEAPPEARPEILAAIAVLDAVEERSEDLRDTVESCPGRGDLTDDLGPLPQRCSAIGPAPTPGPAAPADPRPTAAAPADPDPPAPAPTPAADPVDPPTSAPPVVPPEPSPTGEDTSLGETLTDIVAGALDVLLPTPEPTPDPDPTDTPEPDPT